jgi:hypothetical protein
MELEARRQADAEDARLWELSDEELDRIEAPRRARPAGRRRPLVRRLLRVAGLPLSPGARLSVR